MGIMAMIFMDGFDARDSSTKWTFFSSVTFGTGRFGGSSVNLNLGGTVVQTFPGVSELFVGYAFLPQNGNCGIVFSGDAGATSHITINRNSATQLITVTRGGTTIATGTTVIPVATWHYLEARVIISDTVGVVQVRLDGAPTNEINFSGDTKNAGTSTLIDRFSFLNNNTNAPTYDDVYALDSTGTTNNTFLGDTKIQTLVPVGDGNYSMLTGSDGNSVANWQLVDELPFSTADYVQSQTPNDKDSYSMSNLATGTTQVFAIQSNIVGEKDDAGYAQGRSFVRVGATDYTGPTITFSNSFQNYRSLQEINPATGLAWTPADVNALEAGFEVL
jgi:hypothetical protein